MLVGDHEIDDFEATIRDHGLDVSDFELKEYQEQAQTTEVHAIVGKVTVTRKSTKISKSYRAGHGSSWVVEFSADLDAGAFR